MSIFGKLAGALIGTLFGPFGILLGIILGHFADIAMERGSGTGAFGTETRELVVRIFGLWGRIASYGGGLNQMQVLFLQGVLTNQLQLRGQEARSALQIFQETLTSSWVCLALPYWSRPFEAAREIYQDFFLDRQTLVWIYATGRRLASLGTIRPDLWSSSMPSPRPFPSMKRSEPLEPRSRPERTSTGTSKRGRISDRLRRSAPRPTRRWGFSLRLPSMKSRRPIGRWSASTTPDAHTNLPDTDPLKKKASERFLQVQQAYERIRQARKF